ncbi:MAG TPA: trehalose-6-phosphate synthase, partial [Streptosporangiaceae bacterium]|nr:trehalose-6-phosphate synthase [Streptosporangiaceae bacterium]
MPSESAFVVVANRLPVDRVAGPNGRASWRRSPGGLVSAIAPVMRNRKGVWLGWAGVTDQKLDPFTEDGMDLVPIP